MHFLALLDIGVVRECIARTSFLCTVPFASCFNNTATTLLAVTFKRESLFWPAVLQAVWLRCISQSLYIKLRYITYSERVAWLMVHCSSVGIRQCMKFKLVHGLSDTLKEYFGLMLQTISFRLLMQTLKQILSRIPPQRQSQSVTWRNIKLTEFLCQLYPRRNTSLTTWQTNKYSPHNGPKFSVSVFYAGQISWQNGKGLRTNRWDSSACWLTTFDSIISFLAVTPYR